MSNSSSVESFGVQSLRPEGVGARTVIGSHRFLGSCWFIYGLARILLAVWLIAFETTATMMFGSLLSRVANPFTLMDAFHFFYAVVIVYSFICGVLGALAGLALLTGWSSARGLALWAGFLSLSELPLGLMLGAYTIVKLLSADGERALA